MKRRTFLIDTSLLIALAVAGAVVHGGLTNRWSGDTAQLEAVAETLQLAPRMFGDWRLESETEFDDEVKGILNCTGSWNRKYVHQTSGQVISVAMIVGPPGPTSSHFAELCYTTQGHATLGPGSRFRLELPGNERHEFFKDSFASPDLSAQRQQVCYSWRQTDKWCVPTIPRVAFGGRPFLYKIQVAANYSNGAAGDAEDPCRAFLEQFVPALEMTVFGQQDE